MSEIMMDGRSLHFVENERSDNKFTLLLIHGAGGSLSIWPQDLFELPDARVIALDLPGHGRSSPPGRRAVEQYAAAVETFASTLNLTNLILVGHSMGSAIALMIAWRRVVTPIGLVLFGAGARMPVGSALLDGTIKDLGQVAALIAAKGIVAAPTAYRDEIHQQILATGSMTTYGDFLACNRFDLRGALAGIDSPTLVIAGREDVMTPLKFSQSLAAGLPSSDLLILDGIGHFAMLERPEAALAATREFLTRLAGFEI